MSRCPALLLSSFLAVVAASLPAAAQDAGPRPGAAKPLVVYVVDTEGGKAALYVAPTGESLLIDSGNPGGRDTDRIMAAVADAGLKRIDYLLSTHYHVDHIGGLQELAKRIPIGTFIDHGPSVEEREQVAGFQQAYAELYGKAKHLVVKPGDQGAGDGPRLADRHGRRPGAENARCPAADARTRRAPTSRRRKSPTIPRTRSRSAAS